MVRERTAGVLAAITILMLFELFPLTASEGRCGGHSCRKLGHACAMHDSEGADPGHAMSSVHGCSTRACSMDRQPAETAFWQGTVAHPALLAAETPAPAAPSAAFEDPAIGPEVCSRIDTPDTPPPRRFDS